MAFGGDLQCSKAGWLTWCMGMGVVWIEKRVRKLIWKMKTSMVSHATLLLFRVDWWNLFYLAATWFNCVPHNSNKQQKKLTFGLCVLPLPLCIRAVIQHGKADSHLSAQCQLFKHVTDNLSTCNNSLIFNLLVTTENWEQLQYDRLMFMNQLLNFVC